MKKRSCELVDDDDVKYVVDMNSDYDSKLERVGVGRV